MPASAFSSLSFDLGRRGEDLLILMMTSDPAWKDRPIQEKRDVSHLP